MEEAGGECGVTACGQLEVGAPRLLKQSEARQIWGLRKGTTLLIVVVGFMPLLAFSVKQRRWLGRSRAPARRGGLLTSRPSTGAM
eukprot:g15181.t1